MTNVATQINSAHRGWRWAALLLAASQLLAPIVITRVYGEFLSAGATNDAAITPAGYAFSIWGPITLLVTITCAAILWRGLGAPWETRLPAEASVVFAGFTGWLLLAAQDWLWATVAMFAVMAIVLVDIMRLLVRHADELTAPAWLRRLATVSFGLYLGWSSIAVFVNVAAALIYGGWSATATGWQTAILMAATLTAVGLTVFLRGSVGYVAAALWALVAAAIGAAQRDATVLSASSAAAAALLVVVSAVLYVANRRTG